MNVLRTAAGTLFVAATVFAGALAPSALSQIAPPPPPAFPPPLPTPRYIQSGSTGGLPNPRFVNVYWDPMWNSTVAGAARPELVAAQLNDYTQALIDSEYFDASSGQYGTGRVTFGGGFITSGACPTAAPMAHINDIDAIIGCAKRAGNLPAPDPGANDVYNVFVPLMSVIDWVGAITPRGTIDIFPCAAPAAVTAPTAITPPLFRAYHAAGQNGVFTVIPVNPLCNGTFGQLTQSLSHEMIEAATDPLPFGGWTRYGPLADALLPLSSFIGEVADDCNVAPVPIPPSGIAIGGGHFQTPAPFLSPGPVQAYYSDDNHRCMPAWPSRTPVITGVTVTGVGTTTNLVVTGTGFGTLGASFAARRMDVLPYFEMITTPHGGGASFSSGTSVSAVGPSATTLRYDSWSDTRIVIGGQSGPALNAPGDVLTISVANPVDGSAAASLGFSPEPAFVTVHPVLDTIDAGAPLSLDVHVLDARRRPLTGIAVPLTLRLNNVIVATTATDLSAALQTPVVPVDGGRGTVAATTGLPGFSPVTGSAAITVVPVIVDVSPDHGIATGGTIVTLSGNGLRSLTAVRFGASSAPSVPPGNPTAVKVPAPPGDGTVPVTAVAPGSVASDPSRTFTYFRPGVPILTALRGNLIDCRSVPIDAQAWDRSGRALRGQMVTFSSNRGAVTPASEKFDNDGVARTTLAAGLGQNVTVTALVGARSARLAVRIPDQCVGPLVLDRSRLRDILTGGAHAPACTACAYSDLARSATLKRQAETLAVLGVLVPLANGRFGPDVVVTRVQFNAALTRAVGQPRAGPSDFRLRGAALVPVTQLEAIEAVVRAARLSGAQAQAVARASGIQAAGGPVNRAQLALLLGAMLRETAR